MDLMRVRPALFYPLLLSAAWLGMILLVDPRGEFPLMDDWSYSWSVYHFLTTGQFRLGNFIGVTFVVQFLWGLLFCVLGFSFTALRLSTLVLGWLGVLVVYKIIARISGRCFLAFLCALTVATNCLYFCLSNTFMTDIPFFFFSVTAFLFFLEALRTKSRRAYLLAVLFSCLGVLVRQLILVIPLGFCVAAIIKNPLRLRAWVRACLPFAAAFLVLKIFESVAADTIGLPHWYVARSNLGELFDLVKSEILLGRGPRGVGSIFFWSYVILAARVAVFLFPFLLAVLPGLLRKLPRLKYEVIFLGSLALLFLILRFTHGSMKNLVSFNLLHDFGFLDESHQAPASFWHVLTLIGGFGSGCMLAVILWDVLAAARDRFRNFEIEIFALTAMAAYSVPLVMVGHYDRYDLFYLPLLMVFFVNRLSARNLLPSGRWLAAGVLAALLWASFTVTATHDMLRWRQAMWRMAEEVIKIAEVPAEQIRASHTFTGWHTYLKDPDYPTLSCLPDEWWDKTRQTFFVTSIPDPEWDLLAEEPVKTWHPTGTGKVYLMTRTLSGKA